MADRTISRQRAVTIWGGLFLVSLVATAWVAAWKYHWRGLWLGMLLYALLFVCAAAMGARADRGALNKGITEGLRGVIQPAPFWFLGFLAVALVMFFALGLDWVWRAIVPLTLGMLAGIKWAQQEAPPPTLEPKRKEEDLPPVDFWKP